MQKFCIWETGYKIPKIDCIKLRDLSEISRRGGGVETEGGSQLFETQKREGS